jgi:hypothetical protein
LQPGKIFPDLRNSPGLTIDTIPNSLLPVQSIHWLQVCNLALRLAIN